jgi:glycosyltransferase involved in cell wall biosynthesis
MRILIIGSVWVEPTSSAAGSRMLQLIKSFTKQDWEVHFACGAKESEQAKDLTEFGVKTHAITLNSNSFDVFVKDLQPDVVVFDRYMIEEQYAWRVIEACPNALRILNTEDLHSLRYSREEALKKGHIWEDVILESDFAKREVAAIFRSDLTLMISDFEMELLQNLFHVPKKQLHYCPFILKNEEKKIKGFAARQDFAFIGNFKHKPNADAVMVLKKEVWPILRKLQPQAKLHVYGAYPEQKHMQLTNSKEGFLVHGRAESAQYVFESAKVLLAPLRFGAGLKGKLVEAMQGNCPSITTSIGAEGIAQETEWPGFVENNFADFAKKASELYSNEKLWESSVLKAKGILHNMFYTNDYGKDLIRAIGQAKENLLDLRKQNFIGQMLMHHSMQSTKFLSRYIEEKNKK